MDITLSNLNSSNIFSNEMLGHGLSIAFLDWGYWGNITIDATNTVNGKPILYYERQQNLQLAGVPAAAVILFNCSDVIIRNFTFSSNDSGIHVWNCTNMSIYGNRITDVALGLEIYNSDNNSIWQNTIQRAGEGINLKYCTGCNILGNNITHCSVTGIRTVSCWNTNITENYFCSNKFDMSLGGGDDVSGNVQNGSCPSTNNIPIFPLPFLITFGFLGLIIAGKIKKRQILRVQRGAI